jgi:hypothetical protein
MTEQKKPVSLVGRKNIYQCQECLGIIATIDRDAGTTPFAIGCQARNGCKGTMQSAFYRVFEAIQPTFEWYKPDEVEIEKLSAGSRHHVDMGGLLLRRIPNHEAIADAVKASLPR